MEQGCSGRIRLYADIVSGFPANIANAVMMVMEYLQTSSVQDFTAAAMSYELPVPAAKFSVYELLDNVLR